MGVGESMTSAAAVPWAKAAEPVSRNTRQDARSHAEREEVRVMVGREGQSGVDL
jgi:hypothetical protein